MGTIHTIYKRQLIRQKRFLSGHDQYCLHLLHLLKNKVATSRCKKLRRFNNLHPKGTSQFEFRERTTPGARSNKPKNLFGKSVNSTNYSNFNSFSHLVILDGGSFGSIFMYPTLHIVEMQLHTFHTRFIFFFWRFFQSFINP